MNLNECFEKNLLRKSKPSRKKMESSLRTAKHHLENARKVFSMGVYDLAFVSSYSAMFHSARAVLFNDGVVERSHVCIMEYLRSKRMFPKRLVNLFDMCRMKRHTAQYGLEIMIDKKEAEMNIENAEDFIDAVEKLLQIKERSSKKKSSQKGAT